MTTEELERRITNIEDVEAIKKLKARYCAICDDNHDPEKITGLFTSDAVLGKRRNRGSPGARGNSRPVPEIPGEDLLLAA